MVFGVDKGRVAGEVFGKKETLMASEKRMRRRRKRRRIEQTGSGICNSAQDFMWPESISEASSSTQSPVKRLTLKHTFSERGIPIPSPMAPMRDSGQVG